MEIYAEAIFESAIAARCGHVGNAAGLFRQTNGRGIAAAIVMIFEIQETHRTGMFAERVAAFNFKDIATIHQNSAIQLFSIGDFGHEGAGVAERPALSMNFMDPAPGIAADIGCIIPRAVIHNPPAHEF